MSIRCKSGLSGWRNRLRKNYAGFAEFERISETQRQGLLVGFGFLCWIFLLLFSDQCFDFSQRLRDLFFACV